MRRTTGPPVGREGSGDPNHWSSDPGRVLRQLMSPASRDNQQAKPYGSEFAEHPVILSRTPLIPHGLLRQYFPRSSDLSCGPRAWPAYRAWPGVGVRPAGARDSSRDGRRPARGMAIVFLSDSRCAYDAGTRHSAALRSHSRIPNSATPRRRSSWPVPSSWGDRGLVTSNLILSDPSAGTRSADLPDVLSHHPRVVPRYEWLAVEGEPRMVEREG